MEVGEHKGAASHSSELSTRCQACLTVEFQGKFGGQLEFIWAKLIREFSKADIKAGSELNIQTM